MTEPTLARALDLYRRTATTRSAVILVVANAIPIVGVLFFGWSLWTILVLYWLENGIVGFWNVPRILLAQGGAVPSPLPDMPPEAAFTATGNASQAAALRSAWRQAQEARATEAANAATTANAAGATGQAASGRGRVRTIAGAGRSAIAMFFCLHYGIFWFVHGVFIFALPLFLSGTTCDAVPGGLGSGLGAGLPPGFDPGIGPGGDLATTCSTAFGAINWTSVLIGGIALFVSHGATFLFSYIGRGEYLTATPIGQMAAPYVRVVILHLTIIFGAFVVAFLGAPIGALLILVVLKTAFDLVLHLRERRRADAALRAAAAPAVLAPSTPATAATSTPAASRQSDGATGSASSS